MAGTSSSTPEPKIVLNRGLDALKRGHYQGAIADLQAVMAAVPPENGLSAKAGMALVVAYAKVGNQAQAVVLCQALCRNPNPKVQTWASSTYASLTKQTAPPVATPPQQAPEDPTGFIPLDAPAADSDAGNSDAGDSDAATPFNTESDPTGFVPLSLPVNRSGQPGSRRSPVESRPSGVPAAVAASPDDRLSSAAMVSDAARVPGEAPPNYIPEWRQAGRLGQPRSLGKVNAWRLWLLQAATAVALFWVVQQLLFQPSELFWRLAMRVPLLNLNHDFNQPPVLSLLIGFGILAVGSRWILDGWLTWRYGLRPMALSQLAAVSSEAGRSLVRLCGQRRVPVPELGLLPVAEPMMFSYGAVPWVTRIVVSQGLLDRLAEDELATLYANEVGHIATGTVPLLSLVMVVAQIPYALYEGAAVWSVGKTVVTSRIGAVVGTTVGYGAYRLIRWVALWLVRSRAYFGDRAAAELTGNPNGYTRALLKMAIGMAETTQHQGQTSYLLEGLDLLLPVSPRSATSLGSLYPHMPLEPLLEWDRLSPYRQWLSLNQSHPPLGDRLYVLDLYARHWQLASELDFGPDVARMNRQRKAVLTRRQWQSLLMQAAPFWGVGAGWLVAQGLSMLGFMAFRVRLPALEWMAGDRTLFQALPLIGFSLGTFLRINPFFPDIPSPLDTVQALQADWFSNPDSLPISRRPLRLAGTLVGRANVANYLSQDLWLQTQQGMVRLHGLSAWGPLGNLWPAGTRPTDLLGQAVVVTGWWRRGATAWIDVETVRSSLGRTSTSQHPIWSTALAVIAAIVGVYTIYQGAIFR
jgi:Zn-dependent protease with chaperone function